MSWIIVFLRRRYLELLKFGRSDVQMSRFKDSKGLVVAFYLNFLFLFYFYEYPRLSNSFAFKGGDVFCKGIRNMFLSIIK